MSDTLQRGISTLVRATEMTGGQSCWFRKKRLRLEPAVIICLLCFSAGGSTNAATEALQQSHDEVVCDDAEGHGESSACLERFKGLVERAADTLRLRLSNGQTKVYSGNSHACDEGQAEKCVVYRLARFYPSLQSFLVSVSFYECGHYELVSRRTGSVIEISTIPRTSPGGKYLASTDDSDACDRKYDVAIWSTATDPPSLEMKYQPARYENWQITRWNGDDHLGLKASINAETNQYDQEAEAVRTADGWKLVLGKRIDKAR
jgi:hypothetical protein